MRDASEAPRQAVVLAAGHGQRIGSQEHGVPKPLMRVAGRPLLEFALEQAAAAGCDEALVVVGNGSSSVEDYLHSTETPLAVRIVLNPACHHPNGISLLAAEPLVKGPFYLQMSDHLFEESVLPRLGAAGGAPGYCQRLLVDRSPLYSDEEDATKVRLEGGMVTEIGKKLRSWDAVDTGCFLLDGRVFDALRKVKRAEETSVTAGMEQLIAAGLLAAVLLEGVAWVDVDTIRDQKEAETLFGALGPFRRGVLR